jgi:sulfur dioxygenase
VPCADIHLVEGKPLQLDDIVLMPLHTPGHTSGHFAHSWGNRVFTGDAMLIDGCGRTDFQQGDAAMRYRSVTEKLFSLPDDTLVCPAHDYRNRHGSTIAQEKERNPRLGQGKSVEEFQEIMANLNLPYSKFIDHAVPGNQQCGTCPADLPYSLSQYCAQMSDIPQG